MFLLEGGLEYPHPIQLAKEIPQIEIARPTHEKVQFPNGFRAISILFNNTTFHPIGLVVWFGKFLTNMLLFGSMREFSMHWNGTL